MDALTQREIDENIMVDSAFQTLLDTYRSEERRVGKGGLRRW